MPENTIITTVLRWVRSSGFGFGLLCLLFAPASFAQLKSHVESSFQLEYGPVLYEFYQQQYFEALVENRYSLSVENPIAKTAHAGILHGGMLVSYGMPDNALQLFQALLDTRSSVEVKNRAWYHLAKLYYNKSDKASANRALDKVQGQMPDDLHIEYHYLASLVKNDGEHLEAVNEALDDLSNRLPQYSYLLFNLAVTQLRAGQVLDAVLNLEELAVYEGDDRELLALADRAKHGLAQMATQAGDLPRAWSYLTSIRTSGLYSNRALLSYAWTAIKMKLYNEAIPALLLLDERSIAIPEVQESKVLLAHLYEQQGSSRKALKSNLMAEKAFKKGLATLADARKIIAKQDVPREFISNLEVIMDESDWYGANASVDYKKLTPFLIDLMSSHPFNETLKDLAALYTLEQNLSYWLIQIEEHQLVLTNAEDKYVQDDLQQLLARSETIKEKLQDQDAEIKLTTLTLEESDKERFQVLIDRTEHDLLVLEDKINRLKKAKQPYVQPASYAGEIKGNHKRITKELARTRYFIEKLEPVMRNLVRAELDNHEERMRYYWAQSRLAKARLFDATLLELENVKSESEAMESQ
ncbi:hypothetical protein SAMN02745866_02685 [Alteromonadaceae bacterium Bs31]|nr:hypothetical protein SAMN02745866_02685 [Alteromonadaceae bacterium Bs31]